MKKVEEHLVEKAFISAMENAGVLGEEITRNVEELPPQTKRYMQYIYAALPLSDVIDTLYGTVLSFAEHAVKLQSTSPWFSSVPDEIALPDVVFPRIHNEKIEAYSSVLYDLFSPYIEGVSSMEEAVLQINLASLSYGTYRSPSRRTASPLTFLKRTFGRCGEESTFLTAALRSVGIPARQIYTPYWAHCDDSHAWVEAWCDGQWRFFGACEPEPVLDKGWFNAASARSMLVHARSFRAEVDGVAHPTDETVKELILTDHYAEVSELTIRVLENETPVAGAEVYFEIVNYAEFRPLVKMVTDADGCTKLPVGHGSLMVVVVKDGKRLEEALEIGSDTIRTFDWGEAQQYPSVGEKEYHMRAPQKDLATGGAVSTPKDEAFERTKEINAKKREEREQNAVADTALYVNADVPLDEEALAEVLHKAKYGGTEVLEFLNTVDSPLGFEMLLALDEKDLVDFNSGLMLSHYKQAIPFKNAYPEEIFVPYVLNPRIHFEEISDYRTFIKAYFSPDMHAEFQEDPRALWTFLQRQVKEDATSYQRTIASPRAVLLLGKGNARSINVLAVAALRTIGIPASLHPMTRQPVYYWDGAWKYLNPALEEAACGTLKLLPEENVTWTYGANWSLAQYENGRFSGLAWNRETVDETPISLFAGFYRLLTVNRALNGDTYVLEQIFEIKENEEQALPLKLQIIDLSMQLIRLTVPTVEVQHGAERVSLGELFTEEYTVLVWAGAGEEPTEHILNELIDAEEQLKAHGVQIIFVGEELADFEKGSFGKVHLYFPTAILALDEHFQNHETVARRLFVDPGTLPLVALVNSAGEAIYALSGYNVGTAELLIKIMDLPQK